MRTAPALPDVALDLWHAEVDATRGTNGAHGAHEALVLPDGCRDLIVAWPSRGAPTCFVSALADTAERVPLAAGDRLAGVRLRAGAEFDEAHLLARLRRCAHVEVADLLDAVADAVRVDPRVREALDTLAVAPRVETARASLGVSERALERLLATRTGRSPSWWRGLARARRCARTLAHAPSLADHALVHDYADHAHMTRDLRRWFGAPPSHLAADPRYAQALAASGHGQEGSGSGLASMQDLTPNP